MWSIRISHEAQLYDSNQFVTLTYDDESLPGSLSLEYRDFSGFMKRLRKRVLGVSLDANGRQPVRFFCAGEYGGRTGRPHYHAILFNVRFPDQERYQNGTYRSELCEELWGKGNVVIGDVTRASAAYVAGYTLKKQYGKEGRASYEDVVNVGTGELSSRVPEFVVMSRRPGIGAAWYARFRGDVFPVDHAVVEGKCYKVPRYYWLKYQREADPRRVEEIAYERELRALDSVEESTVERRAVREALAERRAAMFGERGL